MTGIRHMPTFIEGVGQFGDVQVCRLNGVAPLGETALEVLKALRGCSGASNRLSRYNANGYTTDLEE